MLKKLFITLITTAVTIAMAVTPAEVEQSAATFLANELDGILTELDGTALVLLPYSSANTVKLRIDLLLLTRDDVLTAPIPWSLSNDRLSRAFCLKGFGFFIAGVTEISRDTYVMLFAGPDEESQREMSERACGHYS